MGKKICGRVIFNYTDEHGADFIIMQFREDAKLGFVGGKIDGDDLLDGLCREVEEEIGYNKIDRSRLIELRIQENNKIVNHTYFYKISKEELEDIMITQIKAEHFAVEAFGLILIPISLYEKNGYNEGFLENKVSSLIREEYNLLACIRFFN